MAGWRELWHFQFVGNELGAWTLALVTFLVTFTLLPAITGFISARRRRLISHGPPRVYFAIDLTALLIERTSRLFLWAVAVGLGIGGIALALAVQTVLADLLASVSIALDRPFGLGDFLAVDASSGTVEHIGVKSTRLRSLSGEQIIISNVELLKARVRNFGRMTERRAVFQLAVDYDTPVATLAAVPRAVREIIEATPDARFERRHLLSCGERALQFEIVYVLANPDFNLYADAQQRINLRILERFRALEVSFAAAVPTGVRLYGPPSPAPEAGGQQRLL